MPMLSAMAVLMPREKGDLEMPVVLPSRRFGSGLSVVGPLKPPRSRIVFPELWQAGLPRLSRAIDEIRLRSR